ncbi:MAG TPA: diguanylate cyclase [Anaerolineales bacterium]|nr:diguanylate cyclase [Anaerolineales bacterium]
MKILVLNNDLMERTVIQQVLQRNGHEIIPAETSDIAMHLLQQGGIRFVIADRATTDIDEKEFIKRLREAKPPYYIYILLIALRVQDTDVTTPRMGADDYLHKPIVPIELKSRVYIGERILALGDNLIQARGDVKNTAVFDPLTNALNQSAFLTLSRGELERARRAQSSLSLIALDIDNFKAINSQYGKEIGDDVLTVVSQSIREKSRPYDGVARYEDDMFILILPGVIGQDAEKVAERILKGIYNINISLMDGTAVSVNLSAGIASAMQISASTEIETLIQKAIEAVKQAKREGGNQVYTIFI